ncbi:MULTISPECIES: energy transducer TonB [unclassified Sphingomonas]|uniref:energy transducer TonB n=1 Tax=unclassified Sphingomonas TaxID=196159 RepID=UPI00286404F4|nr:MULTISPECIES: energy transducer TonB [unclassified Sphingomonas]MDR6115508.1 TonB family protein [Sphingomonas sp. SORGH_AS_0789]MDR6150821.1 TonB family protein [Sphingomonas sp. SORGH_AS_0742]
MAIVGIGGTGDMWGAGRGLRNGVLALVGVLAIVLFVLTSFSIEWAYERSRQGGLGSLPRDLPVPAVPPRILGNPAAAFGPDSYPDEAMRQGWEGRSSLAVLVDPDGRPTRCEVLESSGHAVLDEATCTMVVGHVRFRPARDEKGQAVLGIYRGFNVRWELPRLPTDAR